jgi:mRNA-decapping enzyme subunit 2
MSVEMGKQCVLVKGWSKSAGWGFPKGKINKDEPEVVCATREVRFFSCAHDCALLVAIADSIDVRNVL